MIKTYLSSLSTVLILLAAGIILFTSQAQSQTSSVSVSQTSVSSVSPNPSSSTGISADDENLIGVAAVVLGVVEASHPTLGARTLESGVPIFSGDRVTTNENGLVQLLLRDETTFTLGPDGSILMAQFIYNSKTESGKMTVEVEEGVFRFTSGKIARTSPKATEIKLPGGGVWIEGTMVIGKVKRMHSQVILLGPGKKNNTGDKAGSIQVWSRIQERIAKVRVDRTGFGTAIEGPDQAPGRATQIPLVQIEELTQTLQSALRPAEAVDFKEREPSASEVSGQTLVKAINDRRSTEESEEDAEESDENINQAAQNATQIGRVLDGVSVFDDLRRIETGQFNFFKSSTALSVGGDYTVHFDIDFGARTVGGGNSHVGAISAGIDGGDNMVFNVPSRSFASGSGSANFTFNAIPDTNGAIQTATANFAISLLNSGGNVATSATHSININAGAATGNGTADRLTGLSTPD